MVLLLELLRELQVGWIPSLGALVGAAALAAAFVAYERGRERTEGLWARPAGEPSLASPLDRPAADPRTVAGVQLVALCLTLMLLAVAFLSGVALDALVFWIIAYGILHMVVYGLALGVNLHLREQVLPVLWFTVGGWYWIQTGNSIGLVFGGGWVLTGLLLCSRLRRLGKSEPPFSAADASEVPL